MVQKWIKYSVLLVLLVLVATLLSGCGGQQNIAQFKGKPVPNGIDGFYDGFTIVVFGLVGDFVDDAKYGIHDGTDTGKKYDTGYVLGAALFFALLLGGGGIGWRYWRPSPVWTLVVGIAILVLLLFLLQ